MRIKLRFSEDAISAIQALGLRQQASETLRLVSDHAASDHGEAVLLRGKSGQVLTWTHFAKLNHAWGAWIECDSERTAQRVRWALAQAGLDGEVRAVDDEMAGNATGDPLP